VNSQTYSVALLEDDPDTRDRLTAALAADPLARLLWSGASVAQCLRWLRDHPVDVMLVDLGLPDGSGLDVIRHCRSQALPCDVMVVSLFGDDASLLSAFSAGANGYLLKDGGESELARHVQNLRSGGSPMSPVIARRLLQHWQRGAVAPRPELPSSGGPRVDLREALTTKEGEVLDLIARGFTYGEVAERLEVSANTVRTHVRNIYGKLDVHNKAEAVFEARAQGWLS
jgi:DNA-binding NarL/FixJ family response regulator